MDIDKMLPHELPQKGIIYQHYKGNRYKIIALGRHSESHEDYVIYQALYRSGAFGDYAIWVRPLALFMEHVLVEGKLMPRFARVDENRLKLAKT